MEITQTATRAELVAVVAIWNTEAQEGKATACKCRSTLQVSERVAVWDDPCIFVPKCGLLLCCPCCSCVANVSGSSLGISNAWFCRDPISKLQDSAEHLLEISCSRSFALLSAMVVLKNIKP